MISFPNFRISKKLDTKFLDIQKFGWKKDKKSGPKFTAFRNGALSSKGVCISKVFKVYHQFMILKSKNDCLSIVISIVLKRGRLQQFIEVI